MQKHICPKCNKIKRGGDLKGGRSRYKKKSSNKNRLYDPHGRAYSGGLWSALATMAVPALLGLLSNNKGGYGVGGMMLEDMMGEGLKGGRSGTSKGYTDVYKSTRGPYRSKSLGSETSRGGKYRKYGSGLKGGLNVGGLGVGGKKEKKRPKTNRWIKHVKDYCKKHNCTYPEGMMLARSSYKP